MIVFSNRLKLETTNGSFVSPPPFRCAKFCTSRWVASQTTARRRALWQNRFEWGINNTTMWGPQGKFCLYEYIIYIYIIYVHTCNFSPPARWGSLDFDKGATPSPLRLLCLSEAVGHAWTRTLSPTASSGGSWPCLPGPEHLPDRMPE